MPDHVMANGLASFSLNKSAFVKSQLAPGPYIQEINTVLWTVDYTYDGTATEQYLSWNPCFKKISPQRRREYI
jgi:hypothetical protein